MVSKKALGLVALLTVPFLNFSHQDSLSLQVTYAHASSKPLLSTDLTQKEKQEVRELKRRLKKEGFESESIDALFEKGFGIYRDIPNKFKTASERRYARGEIRLKDYEEIIGLNYLVRAAPKFFGKYKTHLVGAEKRYGVDKRIIIGITGVESGFNDKKEVGDYNAFKALASQYILMPKRRKEAYTQIVSLIKFSASSGLPASQFNSSYAGAIGRTQYIPESLLCCFVGKNGNFENVNPMDMVDNIFSVPYYLIKHGWDSSEELEKIVEGSKNWDALKAYNPSNAYVRVVLQVALSLSR